MKKQFCLLSIFQIAFCFSQQANEIDAQIDPINGIIKVNQLFSFTNNSNKLIDTLYLYDWNHSYSDTSTPLAVKLAQEFNFKFEKSQSAEKGYTKVDNFRSNLGSLKWHRLEEQKDIIAIHVVNPIQPKDSFQFSALYYIKLPANHFTGYGINNLDEISFRNGFLEFANQSFKGQWNLDSNYGFNDRTASLSSASFSVCFPENSFGPFSCHITIFSFVVNGNIPRNLLRHSLGVLTPFVQSQIGLNCKVVMLVSYLYAFVFRIRLDPFVIICMHLYFV